MWAIRTRLTHDGQVRDLAMFNVAIDSKLRGCDLVKLRVADIHFGDSVHLRTTVAQQKTGRPVPFDPTVKIGLVNIAYNMRRAVWLNAKRQAAA